MTNFNFEIKKQIVEAGESKIFNDWKKHSSISEKDFISALEWLCSDPDTAHPTREIGLTPTGIVKLHRVVDDLGSVSFFDVDTDARWAGAVFEFELDERQQKLYGEKTSKSCYKIQLSPLDKV